MTDFCYPKELYPFEHKWITIDSNHIHYIDEGKGKTILFCHPPVASSFMYRNMIKELSKRFRCIALDFPGFGLSETNANYTQTIASQASIVSGLLKQLELKDIFLLMQEVGGHAAVQAFLQQPTLLKGLIITDTIVFPCSSYPKIFRMLNIINGTVFNFLNTNFNFLIRMMTRFGIRKRKLSKEERNVYKHMFGTKERRRNITQLLFELVKQEKLLTEIQNAFETTFNKMPSLIIYGEKDPLTKLEVPQRIHQLLPSSELHWIKGEAHFPHEGAPQEMSSLIANWLSKMS